PLTFCNRRFAPASGSMRTNWSLFAKRYDCRASICSLPMIGEPGGTRTHGRAAASVSYRNGELVEPLKPLLRPKPATQLLHCDSVKSSDLFDRGPPIEEQGNAVFVWPRSEEHT